MPEPLRLRVLVRILPPKACEKLNVAPEATVMAPVEFTWDVPLVIYSVPALTAIAPVMVLPVPPASESVPVPDLVRLDPVLLKALAKVTDWPLVLILYAWAAAVLKRDDKSVVMPLYCRVPPPKLIVPEEPSDAAFPIATVPALMLVPPL